MPGHMPLAFLYLHNECDLAKQLINNQFAIGILMQPYSDFSLFMTFH